MPKMKFYAVRVGHSPGIYNNWEDCKRQVTGYPGNQYKGFATRSEAEQYIGCVQSAESHTNLNRTIGQPLDISSVSQCPRSKVTGYPGNQYKAFATHSEAEQYIGCVQSVESCADLNRISGQALDSPSVSHCAQPKIIDEGGVPLVVFDSLEDFDKHFENLAGCHKVTSAIPVSSKPKPLQPEVLYQLEFDGASKGNPGKAGAGALLREPDGSVVFEVMEGLGKATNNVAEYCSLILGLREALARGVTKIRVQGDSLLVCLQVRGEWKLKHPNLIPLWKSVMQLKEQFKDFSIVHVVREFNSAADSVANAAVNLPETMFAHEFLPKADSCKQTANEVPSVE